MNYFCVSNFASNVTCVQFFLTHTVYTSMYVHLFTHYIHEVASVLYTAPVIMMLAHMVLFSAKVARHISDAYTNCRHKNIVHNRNHLGRK